MFKKARMQLGLTQAEIARVLNVDAVTVSRWENGQPTNRVVPRFLDALVFLHSLGKLEEFKTFHYTGQEIKQQVEKREEKRPRKLTAKEQKHLDEAKRRLAWAQRLVDTGCVETSMRLTERGWETWSQWEDTATGEIFALPTGDTPMKTFQRWLAKGVPVYPSEWAAWGLSDEEMAYVAMMQGQDWPKEKVMRYVQVRRDG